MDINPLAILISRAKTNYLEHAEIESTIKIITNNLQKNNSYPIYEFLKSIIGLLKIAKLNFQELNLQSKT
jgi:hypothetical protein